jgi:hypothetical protein
VGDTVTFTATVSALGGGGVVPDGTVTFTDGATTLGSGPVTLSASSVATLTLSTLANGPHSIVAMYSGDAAKQVQPSISNTISEDVLVPSVVTVAATPNPAPFGSSVTFTVTVSPNGTAPATGPIHFFDGAMQIGSANLVANTGQTTFTIATLAVGSHPITAQYLGNSSDGPGTSGVYTLVVSQASTATTVAATPTPGIAGGAVSITATVAVTAGQSTPGGTVNFTNGTTEVGSATLTPSGTATIKAIFPPSTNSIVATYSGDTNDAGSASAPLAETVVLATTNSAAVSNLDPSVVLMAVTLTAKVTGNGGIPTGTATFFADGAPLGSATLDATGAASLSNATLAVGTHSITVAYSGDSNDSPGTSPAISQVVTTIPTATALGVSSTGGTSPSVVLLGTVVGSSGPAPTGTVTFTSGSTTLGSAPLNASGVATFTPNLNSGTYTIVASYGGDALHAASQAVPVSVAAAPIGYSIAASPDAVTVPTNQNVTLNVTISSISGFADTIGLGCSSLPAAVNCHFSSNNVNLAANTSQTVQLTIDTNDPLGGGTSTTAMNTHSASKAPLVAGIGLPMGLLLGFGLWRARRRALFAVLLAAAFGAAAAMVSGCSGFSEITATPGTYVIQVTGTGTNSNLTHYENVTLTITKN